MLAWYDAHRQPFPWRSAGDPYSALVAGVAAQQTQMSRVLEIHERWMAAFPTLEDLARADRAEVLRVWGRAGYPRRAVNLHETALRCMADHNGALPRDLEALLALPGIGPFTAAIVRCFGFHEDAVAVDTNIVRVIGRLVFGDLQPATDTPRAAIDAAAARLLRPGTAADWNPALMDYGAHVCTPRPRCDECVVATLCAAQPRFAAGEAATPVRAQARFDGSDRQVRGRLMQVLRDADGDLEVTAVIERVVATGVEAARTQRLLEGLVAEGMAWVANGRVRLGSQASTRTED